MVLFKCFIYFMENINLAIVGYIFELVYMIFSNLMLSYIHILYYIHIHLDD